MASSIQNIEKYSIKGWRIIVVSMCFYCGMYTPYSLSSWFVHLKSVNCCFVSHVWTRCWFWTVCKMFFVKIVEVHHACPMFRFFHGWKFLKPVWLLFFFLLYQSSLYEMEKTKTFLGIKFSKSRENHRSML